MAAKIVKPEKPKVSGWLPGATTVLRVQDALYGSDALTNWAGRTAATAAIEALVKEELGPDHALERAMNALTTARDRGTDVHAGIEAALKDEDHLPTTATSAYWYGWSRFLIKEKPEFIATERKVINPTIGYGTTMDIVARLRGEVAQVDIKSGSVKETHVLQLAAGAMAEKWDAGGGVARNKWHQYQLVAGPTDDPVPLEAHYVLQLDPEAPQGYRLIQMDVDPEREHFAFLVATYHRLKEWKKTREAVAA